MLTWIAYGIFCLGVTGWLALDWWAGWTAPKLDAAINEFEQESRRGDSFDWAFYGFALLACAAVVLLAPR